MWVAVCSGGPCGTFTRSTDTHTYTREIDMMNREALHVSESGVTERLMERGRDRDSETETETDIEIEPTLSEGL